MSVSINFQFNTVTTMKCVPSMEEDFCMFMATQPFVTPQDPNKQLGGCPTSQSYKSQALGDSGLPDTSAPYKLAAERLVCLQSGYKLDWGGIAKGWIVQKTARWLQNQEIHNLVVVQGRHGLPGETAKGAMTSGHHRPDKSVQRSLAQKGD
ncbi:hypothetical protein D2Q93_13900 [Alicyclobacillaceae bacterium I2511]|nr:hypothetical protein D2Q93_13900 [Alicyclobacillaceae bacterium I2511]